MNFVFVLELFLAAGLVTFCTGAVLWPKMTGRQFSLVGPFLVVFFRLEAFKAQEKLLSSSLAFIIGWPTLLSVARLTIPDGRNNKSGPAVSFASVRDRWGRPWQRWTQSPRMQCGSAILLPQLGQVAIDDDGVVSGISENVE